LKAEDKETVNATVHEEEDARRAVEDWESEGGAHIPGPSGRPEEEADDVERNPVVRTKGRHDSSHRRQPRRG
jgi:hypothetical protein